MRTGWAIAPFVIVLTAAVLASGPVEAQRRNVARSPDFSMLLLPATHTQVLEIAEYPPEDPARSVVAPPERRRAVTDLSLRLSTAGNEPLAEMLALQNGARTGRVLFVAELVLVANGRLHVEQRLSCGAWLQDIAICKTDCGEGALALVRKTETPSLSLVIGRTPRSDGEGFHRGLRLGACSTDAETAPAATLVPMRNVKIAQIALRAP